MKQSKPIFSILITVLSLVLSLTQVHAKTYFVHNDQLGTPQVITDNQQQPVWQARYTPFGTAETQTDAITHNIRFPGQYYDQETGLHYNYFRYYDPSIGRYITSDPIGLEGGINTFIYVDSNPINRIDPPGLWSTEAHDYFIDSYFPSLTDSERTAIKLGSASADMPWYQGDSSAHMHAMSDDKSSNDEQCRKMNEYIAKNIRSFRRLVDKKGGGHRGRNYHLRAYQSLGRALHSAMDFTSPAHTGWQHFNTSNFRKHGSWEASLEDISTARLPEHITATMSAMDAAMNGKDLCSCSQ